MLWLVGDGDRTDGQTRRPSPASLQPPRAVCPGPGSLIWAPWGMGCPPHSPRAPPSMALLSSSQAPQPRAELGPLPVRPQTLGIAAASVYTRSPASPPGTPQQVPHPHIPTGTSGFLLHPLPCSPPHWPSSGSPAGPASPANTCQAQGCHPPELGVQGDRQGCWAPWRRPPRGQPRTSVPGLLRIAPGPGPTRTPADPTLFSGLLGALWAVGQSRESRCPEWVSQAWSLVSIFSGQNQLSYSQPERLELNVIHRSRPQVAC